MKDPIGGGFERKLPNDDEPQIAILYAVAGLGTQEVPAYKSDGTVQKRQIMLLFELTEDHIEIKDQEIPMSVQKTFTRSLDDRSNLYKFLLSWRGKKYLEGREEIDWDEMLGGLGMMEIENKKSQSSKNIYTNVVSFNRLQKGIPKPDAMFHEKASFDIEDSDPNWKSFLLLPKWLRKKIAESKEWKILLKSKSIPETAIASLDDDYGKENQKEEKDEEEERFENAQSSNDYEEEEDDDFDGDQVPWENDDEEEDDFTV